MIQGHTFTAVLQTSSYQGPWFRWYTLLHGLTAPMFLFGGGLAYGMVSAQKADAVETPSARMLKRALLLVAIGYGLQLPSVTRPVTEAAFGRAVQVGPLQLIGCCLILAELLRAMLLGARAFCFANASFAALVSFASPFVWKARFSTHVPLFAGNWFDGYQGSLFPFFPWASFFFCGIAFAPLCLRLRTNARGRVLSACLVLVGIGLALGAYGLFQNGILLRSLYGDYELWHTSPLYVVFRTGLLLSILFGLHTVEGLLLSCWSKLPVLANALDKLSRHSLMAYVVHLLLLYGTMFTRGIAHVGPTLSLAESSSIFVAVFAATLLTIEGWVRARAWLSEQGLLTTSVRQRRVFTNVHGVGKCKGTDAATVE